MDNGKTFEIMKMENEHGDSACRLYNAKFNFYYDEINDMHFENERIIATYQPDEDFIGTEYFILYDNDMIWKRVPFYAINSMNMGGIIVGLNKTSKNIMYTFDEGQTYYKLPLNVEYKSTYSVKRIGRYENEALIIYGRNQITSHMIVTHVDFTNIFS
ncbi:hypothetical protein RF11_14920 [Thelohanellus kitauei]|uniref:Uncharacterized protein n=1 Tax=Thelohanellus kitauei TaxID=669202 RepID=A0A0C2MZP7_THEKT|nr:hypothetical protein RF11_14920 [Thelohanellus kitauei]